MITKDSQPMRNGQPMRVGLLLSGGLDSSILLAHLVNEGYRVEPIHIITGCEWEIAERDATRRFIAALDDPFIEPLIELEMPVADLYGSHWSLTGRGVPGIDSPDQDVYLWGRNPLLLVKAALWCQMHGVERLALGTLEGNPFTDATPQFLDQFSSAMRLATGRSLEIWRPFSQYSKEQVLALGLHLPLNLTFSCLSPQQGLHCGNCNKCYERAQSFASLPAGDPTEYAMPLGIASLELNKG